MEMISEIKTGMGTLAVELCDDPKYPGYYIYLHRPNVTRFLAGVIEVDGNKPDDPELKGYMYAPEDETPLLEMVIGTDDFENVESEAANAV